MKTKRPSPSHSKSNSAAEGMPKKHEFDCKSTALAEWLEDWAICIRAASTNPTKTHMWQWLFCKAPLRLRMEEWTEKLHWLEQGNIRGSEENHEPNQRNYKLVLYAAPKNTKTHSDVLMMMEFGGVRTKENFPLDHDRLIVIVTISLLPRNSPKT